MLSHLAADVMLSPWCDAPAYRIPAPPSPPTSPAAAAAVSQSLVTKKRKGCEYSIAERKVPELIKVLGSHPAVGCHYFPPGLELHPSQPLRGCYQFRCLVNRGTIGVNSLRKTVTRQRRGCDLNPGPSAPESSTLTTRLPSRPCFYFSLNPY